jgi:hypothetical protein
MSAASPQPTRPEQDLAPADAMVAASPERTTPPEDPPPTDDETVRFSPWQLHRYVVDVAIERDPARAHVYKTVSPDRTKDGVEVVLALIELHQAMTRRRQQHPRTRCRQHAEQVAELLATTNEADLTLAAAYLQSAYGTLPLSRSQPKD